MGVTEKIAAATADQLAEKIATQARDSGGTAAPEDRAAAKIATLGSLKPAAFLFGVGVVIGLGELVLFRQTIASASGVAIIVLLVALAVLPGLCVLAALYWATKVDHEAVEGLLAVLKQGRGLLSKGN